MTTQITTDNISPTTLEVLGSAVPKVSTIAYPGDDTAANPAGGDTITLTGTGFVAGATVIINGTSAGVVTVVSGTTLTFTAPASNAGTYVIYVINSDGGTAIVIPGISYSGLPNWSTGAGSLGNIYEVSNVNTTVVATGDVPITYSLYSGNLPAGSNINGSTGLISGTAPAAGSPTTYSFVIKATDNEQQDTNRSFSLTINPDTVTWINPANASVTTSYEYANISNVSLSANTESNTSVSFSQSGLPAGLSLTGNTISGSSNTIANTSVTLTATGNVAGRTATRTVYFDVQQDVVTWSSPANNTTYESFTNSAISNVSLSASSAGGQSITYTANTLPTGVSVSGSVISGTATDAANTTTLLTATSALSNRTATRTINWVISVANDPYFKNVTLLLNGETTVTPFISDSSTNSFALTINGDTKPVLFNPYTPGYYSTFFNGSISSYISTPGSATSALNLGTGTCIEGYSYITAVSSFGFIISSVQGTGSFTPWWYVGHDNSGNWRVGPGDGTDVNLTSYPMTRNVWNHFALTNNGTATRLFVNGVLIYYKLVTPPNTDLQFALSQYGPNIQYLITGYLSNIRVIKGSANIPAGYVTSSTTLGTTVFTPSTTPLTAVTGTNLLICQSNRHIDTSTNAFALTLGSTTTINSSHPFTQNSSYSTYGSTYFDGTGDSLRAPYNAAFSFGTNDLTIECWIYNGSLTNASAVGQGQSSGSAGQSVGLFIVSAGTIGWYAAASTGGYGVTITGNVPLNQWNHVAGTRNGSTWTLWINGVSAGTATWAGTVTQDATGSNGGMDIGHLVGSYPYTGYISNVRVVNGTAVYTSGFTPSTTPLTAIANTQLLTLQYNGGATNKGVIDNSNFNNIITRNGNTSQGTFSPYSVTGWSNYFDGTGDYLTVSASSQFALGTQDFCIESWYFPIARINAYPRIFQSGLSSWGTGDNWALLDRHADASTKFGWACYNIGGNSILLQSTTTVSNYQWYHVAVTRSGSTFRMFINGVLEATYTNSGSCTTSATVGCSIGGPGSGDAESNGYISNTRYVIGSAVYTSTFTPSTTPLTAIANTRLLTCQSHRFIDNSPNSFTLNRNGNVTVEAFDPFGSVPEAVPISYSNYFDGTGDSLVTPNNSAFAFGTGDFTIEMWVYIPTNTGTYQLFYNSRNNGTGFAFGLDNGGLKLIYYRGGTLISDPTNFTLNQWTHVALVRNTGTTRIYRNGVVVGTPYADSINYTSAVTEIGRDVGFSYDTLGFISNVRIVKGTAVYTSAFTPSTTPLTAIANTSLLTCQSTRMIDNSANNFTLTAAGDVKPRIFNPFGYTAQSTTSYTPSLHGGSVYLDGTGDSLTTPNIAFSLSSTIWGIEYWIYPTTIASGYYGLWALSTSGFRQGIYADSGTHYLTVLLGGGGYGNFNLAAPNKVITINNWQHIALTSDGTTIRQFYNGVLTSTGPADVFSADTPTVGSWGGATYFTGYMSDFRITKGSAVYTSNFVPPAQALSNYSTNYPASLLLNFNNGGIIDLHGSNVLETLGNAQLSTSVKKYNNSSMYFDGTGDYLYSPPNLNYAMGSGDFTIEFWYYPVTHTNTNPNIMGNYNATWTTNKWAFHAPHATAAGKYSFWVNNYANTPMLASTSNVTNGAWVYLTITRSGSTWRMFVNGTIEATATSSAALDGGTAASMDGLYIGANFYSGEGGRYINAYIDDLRFTKGYARYTSNFTPPTSALITK